MKGSCKLWVRRCSILSMGARIYLEAAASFSAYFDLTWVRNSFQVAFATVCTMVKNHSLCSFGALAARFLRLGMNGWTLTMSEFLLLNSFIRASIEAASYFFRNGCFIS